MLRKEKVKCAECGSVNQIPVLEKEFRVNSKGKTLCCKCCKKIHFSINKCGEALHPCNMCSDFVICKSKKKFWQGAKDWLKKIQGK